MAHMVVKGNVGKVTTGAHENVDFLSWTMAENIGYFDKNTEQWVDKGTIWHDCTISFVNNPKRFQHYCQLIQKGTPLLVVGKLTMSPQEKQNEQGEIVRYENHYLQVDQVALTLERIETISYRQRKDNPGANDPELQQRGQHTPAEPTTAFNNFPGGFEQDF